MKLLWIWMYRFCPGFPHYRPGGNMFTRSFAAVLAGILLLTSNAPVCLTAPPATQQQKRLSSFSVTATEFSPGVEKVRIWMKGAINVTGWVDRVGKDSLTFTDAATLQTKTLDFSVIEKIAKAGQNEPLWRWTWDKMQKAVEQRRVAIT